MLMSEAVDESVKTMDKWEDTGFYELNGLIPKQHFESLIDINEITELFTLIQEKNGGITSSALRRGLKSLMIYL